MPDDARGDKPASEIVADQVDKVDENSFVGGRETSRRLCSRLSVAARRRCDEMSAAEMRTCNSVSRNANRRPLVSAEIHTVLVASHRVASPRRVESRSR